MIISPTGQLYLIPFLVLVMLWMGKSYLDRRIRKGVDHHFDVQLETHRQRLGLEADRVKSDFQRGLANFTLYATRRHQAAEVVYAAVREAHGHIGGLFGISIDYTFEEFNRLDLQS